VPHGHSWLRTFLPPACAASSRGVISDILFISDFSRAILIADYLFVERECISVGVAGKFQLYLYWRSYISEK